jgi:ADP-heptose:LPS heptosyltransferase
VALKPLETGFKRLALGIVTLGGRPRPVSPQTLNRTPLRRILVVRQDDRIGNQLFLTPLLTGLGARFPEASIDVLVSGRYPEILAAHPSVFRLIPFSRRDARRPGYLLRRIRELRRHRYDLVIDGKRRPSLSNILAVRLARCRYRIGFDHAYSRALYHCPVPFAGLERTHESERLHALLDRIWSVPPAPPMTFHFPADRKPGPVRRTVCVHIGGRGRKRIPVAVLGKLIEGLTATYPDTLVIAGPDETATVARLRERNPALRVEWPRDVVELASVIAESRVFVGPDTGALHIASALDRDIVNLFLAPTSPVYGPRSRRWVVIDYGDPDAVPETLAFVDEVRREMG